MSGYLQRMALSAMKPGGTIQPVIGSLFAPSPYLSQPDVMPLEGAQPATTAAPEELPPRAAVRPLRRDPVSRVTEPPSERPRASVPVKSPVEFSIEAFTPMFPANGGQQQDQEEPETHGEPESAIPREEFSHDPESEKAVRDMRPREAAAAPGQAREASPRQAKNPFRIQTPPPEEPAGQDFRIVPAFKPPANRGDGTGRNGTSRAEPDEIEIHIGRIEVIAAPPAPAARPAPPARKSMSLDEYLKRNNRRGS
jgi:hypothetical protein